MLLSMKQALANNGEIILETLIAKDQLIMPKGTYAAMKNIYFIPTIALLKKWCEKAGFSKIKVLDISKTTSQEQRCTQWSTNQSLKDFLNPNNPELTKEGYSAPIRAIIKIS